jgi:hypothetical protein
VPRGIAQRHLARPRCRACGCPQVDWERPWRAASRLANNLQVWRQPPASSWGAFLGGGGALARGDGGRSYSLKIHVDRVALEMHPLMSREHWLVRLPSSFGWLPNRGQMSYSACQLDQLVLLVSVMRDPVYSCQVGDLVSCPECQINGPILSRSVSVMRLHGSRRTPRSTPLPPSPAEFFKWGKYRALLT